ncbi:MAG: Ig-like domain-containing protein [Marinisporobacter sp.]|nr:Ig-like domain-containing protein [Marinisporobacter sp.]
MIKKQMSIILIFTMLFSYILYFPNSNVYGEELVTVTEKVYDEKKIDQEKLEIVSENENVTVSQNVYNQVVCDALDKLKIYYQKNSMDYLPAMAYCHASDELDTDIPIIGSNLRKYTSTRNVYNCYKGIMSTIASRQDPKSFEYNGATLNYVDALVGMQKDDGKFTNSLDIHAYCMIALDMANAEYNKEKAIQIVKDAFTIDGDKAYIRKYGSTPNYIKTAIGMIALSNHREIDGVEDLINKCINYIKSKQEDDGGFGYSANAEVLGSLVQALVAVGKDPLSAEFIKKDQSILDKLMKYQMDDGRFKSSSWGNYFDRKSTEAAFAALADLKKQRSMYHDLSGQTEDLIPSKIILQTEKNQIIEGKTLRIKYKVLDDDNKSIWGQKIIWKSSNTDIATVQKGIVTAKTQGKVTITAELENNPSIQDSIDIQIATREPSKIKIYFNKKEVNEALHIKENKEDLTLTAEILDQDDCSMPLQEILWSSNDENIATINENGEIIVKAIGIVEIMAKVKESQSITNTIEVNIEPVMPTTLEVTIDKNNIEVGKKIQLKTTVYDQDHELIKDANIQWKINPEGSGNIDENAVFTALKEGNVTITAFLEKNDGSKLEKTIQLKIKKEESKEEKLSTAINDVKEYFKTFDGRFSNTYDEQMAVGLKASGLDGSDIESKMNIYPMNDLHNNARNIMTIIASGNNPYDYKNKNYIERILKANLGNEDGEAVSKAIVALDMAEASYDKEKFVKALISKGKDEGEGKISFGSESSYWDDWDQEWVYNYSADVETTCYTLMALSKYKDMNNVVETIAGIKKYLKSKQEEDAFIENCSDTSFVVQGLMAIGEDPLIGDWVKIDELGNKTTMLDAILSCREQGKFKAKPDSYGTANIQTKAAFNALLSLYKNKCVYNEVKYVQIGEIDHLNIVGDREIQVVEGDQLTLIARAYDSKNNEIKDVKIIWESLDPSKATIKDGIVTALSEGEVTIKVSIEDKGEFADQINIKIKSGISDEVLKQRAKDEIEFLKSHYEVDNQYEFLAAPAANLAGMNKGVIQNNLFRYSRPTGLQYARMIIAVRGSGKDPRKDEHKKDTFKNYVDVLTAHQIKEGIHKGQFLINKNMDKDNIETLAYAIIALDMVDADYNQEEAVKALLKLIEDKDEKDVLGYEKIKSEALVLTAIAKYKDIQGVPEKINELIDYLRNQQNEDGGFDTNDGYFKNSPVITGMVIQGLIANDINPLYDKTWMKNKKTMMDGMLKSKYVDASGDLRKSGYCQSEGLAFKNIKATYHAFAALVDMYEDASMFEKLSINYDESIKTDKATTISILQPENDKLLMGQTLKLQTAVFDNQYNWIKNSSIVWTSSNEGIATVKEGVIEGKNVGKVTITATVKDTDVNANIEIAIEGVGISKIQIDCNKDKIRVGDCIELKATAFDKVGTPIKNYPCNWTIDDESIAKKYEKEGKIYLEGLTKGQILVKATLKDNPDIKHEITIDVIDKKSAKVKVRVEGSKNNIIPETELEVDNFDMGIYGDGSCIVKENPTVMNALIAALQKNNIDCTDKEKFDAGNKLGLLDKINGLKTFGAGPNSGWKYYVNDQYVNDYMNNININDGNEICVYYAEDHQNNTYTYFEQKEVIVTPNESFTLQLKGRSDKGVETDIKEANIVYKASNEKAFKNDLNVLTDQEGKATFKFEKEGEYIISATRISKGVVDISRPYCKVKVTNSPINDLFEINVLNDDFSKGEEARLNIKVKNKLEEPKNMVCKIQLCDENNKVLKASSIEKALEANGETICSPGFSIPEDGVYTIKVYLSDKEEIDVFKPVKIITMD